VIASQIEHCEVDPTMMFLLGAPEMISFTEALAVINCLEAQEMISLSEVKVLIILTAVLEMTQYEISTPLRETLKPMTVKIIN
jgi:hypothetical protein